MRKLWMTLFVGAIAGLGLAFAQSDVFLETAPDGDVMASRVIGADLFLVSGAVSETRVDAVPDGWERVTDVNDVLLGSDGEVRGVLVDVGGFLGIGARNVLVSMEALTLVEHSDSDAVYVTLDATREQLENAPGYLPADRAEPGEAVGRVGAPAPGEGFDRIEWGELAVDDLRGAPVYDRNDERVSEIEDLLLGNDDQVTAALINVGGFLGIGSRTVAVPMDQLEIHSDADLEDLRVYLAISEEELEELPAHEE